MGNTKPKTPPKTAKQLKREMNRSIDRMIRDINREKFRMKTDLRKLERELETSIKKKEPRSSQKLIAQNILRQKGFMTKYDIMEAKMKGVKVQIAQVSSVEAMVTVMKNMGQYLNKANQGININNIQGVIENFNMKLEEQENIGEMMDDAMDVDEDEIDDVEVDQYLNDVSDRIGGGGKGGMKNQTVEKDDFTDMIQDLKK